MSPLACGSHSARMQYLVWGRCLPLMAPVIVSSTKMEPSMQLASKLCGALHKPLVSCLPAHG